jgi:tol-pal system protein YbgF
MRIWPAFETGKLASIIALALGITISGLGFSSNHVVAQVIESDVADLRARVRRLERALKLARRGRAATGASRVTPGGLPPTLAARFQVKINQLQRSLRDLTGKIEDLAYQVKKLKKAQVKKLNDIEYRLSLLEKGRGGRTSPGASGKPSAKKSATRSSGARKRSTAILPPGRPSEQYRYALGLLRKGKYPSAKSALRAYIQRYPRGIFTGNAYYWLGEAHYAQGRYRQAAIHFADGYQKFPKHAKAADNLLKLGMSMARLKRKREACATFRALRLRYPNAAGSLKRRALQERRRIGCA